MHRCTSPIRTAHGSALSDKKLHLDQKMANSHCFAQGRALGSISRRKRRLFTPQYTSRIAVKNLTPDPENAWALHPLLLDSFLNLGGCTSELNLHPASIFIFFKKFKNLLKNFRNQPIILNTEVF